MPYHVLLSGYTTFNAKISGLLIHMCMYTSRDFHFARQGKKKRIKQLHICVSDERVITVIHNLQLRGSPVCLHILAAIQLIQQLSKRLLLLMHSFRSSNQHFKSGRIHTIAASIHSTIESAERIGDYTELIFPFSFKSLDIFVAYPYHLQLQFFHYLCHHYLYLSLS